MIQDLRLGLQAILPSHSPADSAEYWRYLKEIEDLAAKDAGLQTGKTERPTVAPENRDEQEEKEGFR